MENNEDQEVKIVPIISMSDYKAKKEKELKEKKQQELFRRFYALSDHLDLR